MVAPLGAWRQWHLGSEKKRKAKRMAPTPQGGEDSPSTLVWPGSAATVGGFTFRQYAGYQVFEMMCDDFDDRGLSWSMVKE